MILTEPMKQILIQTGCYFGVLVLTVFMTALLFRGFFWPYLKVRMSFGKLIMIKIRNPMRDYFNTGKIEDGFLLYGKNKDPRKLAFSTNKTDEYGTVGIGNKSVYKCMGVNWIDVDEDKNAICCADYSSVSGFDHEKYSNLYVRALTRPTIKSNSEIMIIILVITTIILGLATAYLAYNNLVKADYIIKTLPTVCKGIITATTGSV